MSTAKAELVINTANSNHINSMLNTSINSSNEPFKSKELEEKKRKLHLPLSIQNPSSSSTVLQTSESFNGIGLNKDLDDPTLQNKKQKTMYKDGMLNLPTIQTTNEQSTTSTCNKDLFDLNNNLTTPQIEKLLADINTSGTLRTPGSALAILTPMNANGTTPVFTLPFLPQISIEDSSNQSNLIQLTNTNNMSNGTNTNTYNNNNNNNNTINDPAITPTVGTLINPNTIFCYTNSITSFVSGTTPTYEILGDDNKMNGKPGTFYFDPSSNSLNNNGMSNSTNNMPNGTVSSEFSLKLNHVVKDELQTVPILENDNASNMQSNERVDISVSNQLQKRRTNTKAKKENKNESVEVSNSIHSRRDTDSSTSSYANMDDPEQARLEKKRERNREAARKCRTRKLEKIATLETQVADLVRQNQAEKDKTKKLRDEIEILKKKIEEHQKIYSCDIKLLK